ncbi:hypothetical protein [Mycobacterium sp. DBP42]|uniref:hypothetical protein n=1 Tax=Mycobacterium sp. DBP42 TaxID=2545267 RepID=UPI00110CE956|nr:hypothetical protein [Mycobacterium sp. DBP42]TMS53656.1 hypothetical protein E0T84_10015 [Mycobacterium sp. DBP42]
MRYWMRQFGQGALLIRAASDPLDDFDIAPQVWDWNRQQWVDDDDVVDELQWDPNIRSAPESEVLRMQRGVGSVR